MRDCASQSPWDKSPRAPEIPPDVVNGMRRRYEEAYERITGEPFDTWLAASGAPR